MSWIGWAFLASLCTILAAIVAVIKDVRTMRGEPSQRPGEATANSSARWQGLVAGAALVEGAHIAANVGLDLDLPPFDGAPDTDYDSTITDL